MQEGTPREPRASRVMTYWNRRRIEMGANPNDETARMAPKELQFYRLVPTESDECIPVKQQPVVDALFPGKPLANQRVSLDDLRKRLNKKLSTTDVDLVVYKVGIAGDPQFVKGPSDKANAIFEKYGKAKGGPGRKADRDDDQKIDWSKIPDPKTAKAIFNQFKDNPTLTENQLYQACLTHMDRAAATGLIARTMINIRDFILSSRNEILRFEMTAEGTGYSILSKDAAERKARAAREALYPTTDRVGTPRERGVSTLSDGSLKPTTRTDSAGVTRTTLPPGAEGVARQWGDTLTLRGSADGNLQPRVRTRKRTTAKPKAEGERRSRAPQTPRTITHEPPPPPRILLPESKYLLDHPEEKFPLATVFNLAGAEGEFDKSVEDRLRRLARLTAGVELTDDGQVDREHLEVFTRGVASALGTRNRYDRHPSSYDYSHPVEPPTPEAKPAEADTTRGFNDTDRFIWAMVILKSEEELAEMDYEITYDLLERMEEFAKRLEPTVKIGNPVASIRRLAAKLESATLEELEDFKREEEINEDLASPLEHEGRTPSETFKLLVKGIK